ncbi:hypothetical protein ACGH2B_14740 [Streptomyces sp. BBFR2]|uniref:hypothetical protein n=1 Tax=Streptomyces sp. BBFR2 TaxID=3372854 RepID=UPI0037DA666C
MAGPETGVLAARSRALAVLRIRGAALAVALLPAAVAVVLLVGGATGRLGTPDAAAGSGWGLARLVVSGVAVLTLALAVLAGAVVAGARPALSPSVPVSEEAAPDLYRLVRELADRLDVPAPSALALTPDCDSWLEDRTHRAHGPPRGTLRSVRKATAPVLVIGSPFLWWMRVGELRALLAPVVAGTGPAADPDIAAARRFIRGLDAAVAVAARARGVRAPALRFAGLAARLMLRACRDHATLMERAVAAAASERAQDVDHRLRTVAQEQVGLAYAGWDRLLTRVALPAWRLGRWPAHLDSGVVSALTELSRRDRLADGFTARLGERPACDLLEEPGLIDGAASLLAARLFHGGPATAGPGWSPVGWSEYPDEVVDRTWRLEAARLHRVLDDLPAASPPATDAHEPRAPEGPAAHPGGSPDPAALPGEPGPAPLSAPVAGTGGTATGAPAHGPSAVATATAPPPAAPSLGPTLERVIDQLSGEPGAGDLVAARLDAEMAHEARTAAQHHAASGTPGSPGTPGGPEPLGHPVAPEPADTAGFPGAPDAAGFPESADRPRSPGTTDGPGAPETTDRSGSQGAKDRSGYPEAMARPSSPEASGRAAAPAATGRAEVSGLPEFAGMPELPDLSGTDGLTDGGLPLFPLQPPRTGRDLLADHVTAMVCCTAVDTAGAAPGLDWLDGPALLIDGARRTDLGSPVRSLVEDGDAAPLRAWLATIGARPEKPVRLP